MSKYENHLQDKLLVSIERLEYYSPRIQEKLIHLRGISPWNRSAQPRTPTYFRHQDEKTQEQQRVFQTRSALICRNSNHNNTQRIAHKISKNIQLEHIDSGNIRKILAKPKTLNNSSSKKLQKNRVRVEISNKERVIYMQISVMKSLFLNSLKNNLLKKTQEIISVESLTLRKRPEFKLNSMSKLLKSPRA